MIRKYIYGVIFILGVMLFTSFDGNDPQWGFFGHRTINKMAVFTLPPELIKFYRLHIEYVSDHSVDPDKRRYAVPLEGPRHYMDLDHYGQFPFDNVPRDWENLVANFSDLASLDTKGDTIKIYQFSNRTTEGDSITVPVVHYKTNRKDTLTVLENEWMYFVRRFLLENYNRQAWTFTPDKVKGLIVDPSAANFAGIDLFTEHGVLPYNLLRQYQMLVNAFKDKNIPRVLRISSDIGHYIGDAHVPLHTTTNYNGQLTNQLGIHAFWESRLPELFALDNYDFFVGKAQYINNPSEYFWKMTLESHLLVDSVLTIEKELSRDFPSDQQYCYEERLGKTILQPCFDFSKAYHEGLNGMVETRMRETIIAIGNIWLSAWVDAGQPNLTDDLIAGEELTVPSVEEETRAEGSFKTRAHE